jgi:hypothetical protein
VGVIVKHRKLDRNLARYKGRFAKPAGIFVALFVFYCICSLAKADSILPGPTYSTTGGGTVSLSPDASVFADAVIGPMESGGGSATLTYYFEVLGPANASATIDITGEALVAFDGVQDGTYFSVGAGIELGGETLQNAFCSSSYDPADCVMGVEDTIKQGVLDNTQYTLTLAVNVSAANYYTDATTTVAALVDPMISFDPSFNSTGFSLDLSPGVGNEFIPSSLTPAPEPRMFFVMGAAILLSALAVRFQHAVVGNKR